jgi:hypothetical protein
MTINDQIGWCIGQHPNAHPNHDRTPSNALLRLHARSINLLRQNCGPDWITVTPLRERIYVQKIEPNTVTAAKTKSHLTGGVLIPTLGGSRHFN